MDTKLILEQLRAERARLDLAIRAIAAISGDGARSRTTASTTPKKRRLSAAARKRLSELLRKRWAEGKMKNRAKPRGPRAAKKAKGTRQMSPAGRKRLSELMKRRWAKRKRAAKPQPAARVNAAKQTTKKAVNTNAAASA